jgi:hypothetical protein
MKGFKSLIIFLIIQLFMSGFVHCQHPINYQVSSDKTQYPPVVIPGGRLHYEGIDCWFVKDSSEVLVEPNKNYSGYYRGDTAGLEKDCKERMSVKNVTIDNDVTMLWVSTHYFHFFWETLLLLQSLKVHGILDQYPNATIICSSFLSTNNFQQAALFGLDMQPYKFTRAESLVNYTVSHDRKLIVPQNARAYWNNPISANICRDIISQYPHHTKLGRILYLTRRGDRRGVANEYVLLQELRKFLHLQVVECDKLTLLEQANLFSEAAVIIGPHGSAFTNMIFSSNNITVIEFSGNKHHGTQKHFIDLMRIKNYHIIIGANIEDSQGDMIMNLTDVVRQVKLYVNV